MTWQEILDTISKNVGKDNLEKQIVYVSTDEMHCLPQISIFELKENKFPFVVTPPDPSMKDPKYNWLLDNPKWEDLSATQQADSIDNLKETVAGQVDEIIRLKKQVSDSAKAQSDILALVGMAIPQEEEEETK